MKSLHFLLRSGLVLVSALALQTTALAGDFEDMDPVKRGTDCAFAVPESIDYDANVVSVRRKLRVQPEEEFKVKAFIKNNSNVPWFSVDSSCKGAKVSLGTDKERDRDSELYSDEDGSNWLTPNRIKMDQERVNPGEIGSFTFYSTAGSDEDVLKEFFTPMIEGVTWMDNGQFSFEVIVGSPDDSAKDLRKKLSYAAASGSVLDLNLDGEKLLLTDLSEQKLYVQLDGKTIREFQISSGAAKTPTPLGEYEIQLKQEMRVGGKAPHYRMPYFMWWRDGGYGFHALPSLGTDGGVFWTEARNHIGIPVSHGCIRLLPEDAKFAFEFAEIGTKVKIQR